MDEMMIEFGLPKMKIVSTSENKKNRKMVIEEWRLGPENPSIDPKANKEYWKDLGKALGCDEKRSTPPPLLKLRVFLQWPNETGYDGSHSSG